MKGWAERKEVGESGSKAYRRTSCSLRTQSFRTVENNESSRRDSKLGASVSCYDLSVSELLALLPVGIVSVAPSFE